MGKLWERAQNGVNNVLNVGVTEDMPDEEKERKRKRNRVVILAGVAAVGVTAVGFALHNSLSAHDVHTGVGGGEIPTTAPSGGSEILTTAPGGHGVENLPLDTGAGLPGAEIVTPGPEVSIPAEAFNIPRGLGGEQLFSNLGIDPSKWYNNESSLLSQFPSDLYRMSDGHVGISHTGMLSQGLQDAIEAIKS